MPGGSTPLFPLYVRRVDDPEQTRVRCAALQAAAVLTAPVADSLSDEALYRLVVEQAERFEGWLSR